MRARGKQDREVSFVSDEVQRLWRGGRGEDVGVYGTMEYVLEGGLAPAAVEKRRGWVETLSPCFGTLHWQESWLTETYMFVVMCWSLTQSRYVTRRQRDTWRELPFPPNVRVREYDSVSRIVHAVSVGRNPIPAKACFSAIVLQGPKPSACVFLAQLPSPKKRP